MATIAGSKPPSSSNRSARMRVNPPGATNTSRTASCWPWSTSSAWTRSTTAPVLSALIPTCKRTEGSAQRTILGVTIPALDRKDSSTKMCTASGSGAQSSWHRTKKAAPSIMPRASLAAVANARSPSRRRTKASGSTAATRARGSSVPPATRTSTESSS